MFVCETKFQLQCTSDLRETSSIMAGLAETLELNQDSGVQL